MKRHRRKRDPLPLVESFRKDLPDEDQAGCEEIVAKRFEEFMAKKNVSKSKKRNIPPRRANFVQDLSYDRDLFEAPRQNCGPVFEEQPCGRPEDNNFLSDPSTFGHDRSRNHPECFQPQQPISACDEPMFEPVQNIKQKCVNKNFCHPVNSDCQNNLTMPITEPLMPTKLCLYPKFEFDQVYPNCAVQSSCQTETSFFQPPYGGAREVEDLLKTIFGGLRKKEEEVSKVESAEDAFWQAVFSEEE